MVSDSRNCVDAFVNIHFYVGDIPHYSIVFPHVQKVQYKEKRSVEDTTDEDYYMMQGLPIPDMMVKLRHNTKLFSPGYGFNIYHCLRTYVCISW